MPKLVMLKNETKSLKAKLKALGENNSFIAKKMSEAMGQEALKLAKENAANQRNVQGRAWKKKKDKNPIGSWLLNSIQLVLVGTKFKIISTLNYGIYFIKGAKKRDTKWKLPARSFAPRSGQLPASWQSVLDAANNVLKNYLWS